MIIEEQDTHKLLSATCWNWCLNGVIIHDFCHFQCINFMLHQHAVLTSFIHLQSTQINMPVRHGDTAVKSGVHW